MNLREPGSNQLIYALTEHDNHIEEYGEKNGYHFQHAMNGGEYYIKELGYWVDGYDKEKNAVIEYDEKHHFVRSTSKKKDVERQKQIKEFLGCKFIRIKYDSTISEI